MLFQKRVVRNKLDIYVFLINSETKKDVGRFDS